MPLHRLGTMLRRFTAAREGNVVIIFALALIPVMGLVGAAVDYSRAARIRSAMQAAGDSAALAIARTATTKTAEALQADAYNFVKATLTHPDAEGITVTTTYVPGSAGVASTIKVDVKADMKTTFVSILGISQMTLGSSSTTTWGTQRLRIALVLDVTGSMQDNGKIDALKTATKGLLDQLKAAAVNNGDVYVSIVPFAHFVNVGKGNYGAPWLKWSGGDDLWDENNGSCSKWGGYDTKKRCTQAGGTWTPGSHSNDWDGSVIDRDQNYDVQSTAPTSATTRFPAGQGDPSYPRRDLTPATLKALTYDWTALKALVNNLAPGGGTSQPIGIAWGWHSLTKGGPLTVPNEDPAYQYTKVMVVLSDGLNTMDRWYGSGSSHSIQVDARQAILCNNIKAVGIIMYTVQVNTTNDPTATALRDCASGGQFSQLTSASQIVDTFANIGTAITRLRVSK